MRKRRQRDGGIDIEKDYAEGSLDDCPFCGSAMFLEKTKWPDFPWKIVGPHPPECYLSKDGTLFDNIPEAINTWNSRA